MFAGLVKRRSFQWDRLFVSNPTLMGAINYLLTSLY